MRTVACETENYDCEEELDAADGEGEDLQESHAGLADGIERSGICTTWA